MRDLRMLKTESDFSVKRFDLDVLPEVETEEKLKGFTAVYPEAWLPKVYGAVLSGIANLANEPEKFRVKPKLHVDLVQRLAYPVPWPVYVATEQVSDLFIPVGLSIGLLSKDDKVIAIQRSLKNKSCKGFLGCPAGYMIIAYEDFATRKLPLTIDLKEEIKKNIEDQLLHELGLNRNEYGWRTICLLQVDYPSNQQEFLVFARANLSADEICIRAAVNKGTATGLAENRVIPMTTDQLSRLIQEKIPGATQHLAALLFAAKGLNFELIKNLDKPDPSIPYEKEIII